MKNTTRVLLICFIFCNFLLKTAAAEPLPEGFKNKLLNLKWVAYAPTNFDPTNSYPPEDSIKTDLELLYKYGFRGIVTYGSYATLGQIPRIAKEAGFEGIIMGIWTIDDRDEVMNAILSAEYVDGYCVGNEGLNSRYDSRQLKEAISLIKKATRKPATTTEQVSDYYNDEVLNTGDWVFPNIHPFLAEVKEPEKAAKWIEKHYQNIKKHCSKDRVVIFKEAGYPTAGAHYANANNQKIFFAALEKTNVTFVYFEAFDQPWKKDPPVEPYWGLFTQKRKPKKFISSIAAQQ